jgi:hypothetical protein
VPAANRLVADPAKRPAAPLTTPRISTYRIDANTSRGAIIFLWPRAGVYTQSLLSPPEEVTYADNC